LYAERHSPQQDTSASGYNTREIENVSIFFHWGREGTLRNAMRTGVGDSNWLPLG